MIFCMLPTAFNVEQIFSLYTRPFFTVEESLGDYFFFPQWKKLAPDSEWCHRLSPNSRANEVNGLLVMKRSLQQPPACNVLSPMVVGLAPEAWHLVSMLTFAIRRYHIFGTILPALCMCLFQINLFSAKILYPKQKNVSLIRLTLSNMEFN